MRLAIAATAALLLFSVAQAQQSPPPSKLPLPKAESSGKADHYAETGENGDGRPHSLRQPKAGSTPILPADPNPYKHRSRFWIYCEMTVLVALQGSMTLTNTTGMVWPEITRRRHTRLIQRGPILFTAEGTLKRQ
jgi:hypothetical protein